jgi:transcription antitermination factor NusG
MSDNLLWYVLRVTYQRELIIRDRLQTMHIECFVPTHVVKSKNKSGKIIVKRTSVLHNYVFVHTSAGILKQIKTDPTLPGLRYVMMNYGDETRKPMIVPDRQMLSFIAVAGQEEESILYFQPGELDLTKGDKVRIIGGPFAGVEGIFIQTAGKHEKRVIVEIPGILAVGTTSVKSSLVEKI